MAKREVDAGTCEAEAEKTASDLYAERARLELLQEALQAQSTVLKRRETNVERREAAHQANADAGDARLRKRHDDQEASNKKALANALAKQKEDAHTEYKQRLALQKTRFTEKNKVLETKCANLEK